MLKSNVSKSPPDNKLEGMKLQFQARLSEYDKLRDEVLKIRELQGQGDNVTLSAFGLSIPIVLTILEKNPQAIGAVLLAPIIYFSLAFSQLRHEKNLMSIVTYIDSEIRPQLNRLLTELSISNAGVFGLENYIFKQNVVRYSFLKELIQTTSYAALSLIAGVTTIFGYVYLRYFLINSEAFIFEHILLGLDSLILLGILILAILVSRIRYRYVCTFY